MSPAGSADNPAARALAIADALEALFAARHDDATARFDTELATAVANGRIDEETARTLRWWQRESVRAARSYLADLLPGVLHADDAAQRRSRAQVDLAAASWQEATDVVHDAEDAKLRVRLVAVSQHGARPDDGRPTASSNGKDTSGDDHSATTA